MRAISSWYLESERSGSYSGASATGHLLLVREGRLPAAPFDAERVEISGPEVPLVPRVGLP